MKALVLDDWGRTPAVRDVPDPVPGPGQVVVEVAACGVGLTTRNCIRGDLGDDPALLPVIPGHELVGTVVAAGAGTDAGLVGHLATTHFYLFCGRCAPCLRGDEPLCDVLGGVIGVQHDGGLAERAVLPERNLIVLPGGVGAVEATVIPDAVATSVHVTRRAGVVAGTRAAVIGAGGGVGAHMVQVLALYGAEVAGLDVVPHKLAFLQDELGIAAIDATDPGRASLPTAWRGRADVIVDLIGSGSTVAFALAHLAPGGRLVLLTTFPGVSAQVAPRDLVLLGAGLLGSRYAGRAEVKLAAELVATQRVRPVIGAQADLGGTVALLERIEGGELLGRGAVVLPGAGNGGNRKEKLA